MKRTTIWETIAASTKSGKGVEVEILEQLTEMNRRLERLERAMTNGIDQPEARPSAPRTAA
jgi:hypothetical protein